MELLTRQNIVNWIDFQKKVGMRTTLTYILYELTYNYYN